MYLPGPSYLNSEINNYYCAIQWIVIYLVDSVIHLLNNWGLKFVQWGEHDDVHEEKLSRPHFQDENGHY